MKEVVVVAAKRTATGNFQGMLASHPATTLGATVIRALIEENNIPVEEVEQVIMGQVLTAGCGQNPARQSALLAGLPVSVNALTINKVCGSGLKAVHLAMQAIQCGDAEMVIAGGQENMSLAPHIYTHSRTGQRLGHTEIKDSLIHDGLWDAYYNIHMGITAENVAEKYRITRSQQDEYSLQSHQRASLAQRNGIFNDEIVPIEYTQKGKEPLFFDKDESIRETSLDKLSSLAPVFKKNGSVTAGNSSTLNDGAAAILLCSREKASQLNLPVIASLGYFSNTGISPEIMGAAPIQAIEKCLKKQNWKASELDVLESNEAFAAQALAVLDSVGVDPKKVNPSGGAIALGHAIGASGCRILVTLIHHMKRNQLKKGIAALCIGGGEGVALAVTTTDTSMPLVGPW